MQGYLQGNLNKHALEIQIKGQVFGFFAGFVRPGQVRQKVIPMGNMLGNYEN